MSAKRFSIGQVMMVVALVAVNLALMRAMPLEVVTFPLWNIGVDRLCDPLGSSVNVPFVPFTTRS